MLEGLTQEQRGLGGGDIIGQGREQGFDAFVKVVVPDKEQKYIKVREYSVSSSGDSDEVGDIAVAKATFYLFGDIPYCNVNDVEVKVVDLRKGSGIGSALMRKIEEDAIKFGCKYIDLLARALPTDDHPYGFYKKLGYINSDGLNDQEVQEKIKVGSTVGVRMTKQLSS